MKIYLLTPFPDMTKAVISESILGRAETKQHVQYHVVNLFDFADPPHFRIDDYPFGGGNGMILKPEPVFRALESLRIHSNSQRVVFPTPDGEVFNQKIAYDLAESENLVFINGHYKGIDQRIRDELVTDEISIGDYVLTGGELPSLVMLDAIVRLLPGVLNSYESVETDSFTSDLLDGPHYTRPDEFNGMKIPDILLSGHHKNIDNWRLKKREEKTKERRTDLWKNYIASRKDIKEDG